ncbi:ICOS ligand [Dasypus novemcinctus]|uniref:ICOS ligand n=1 Tax=Dasypus novemcinctus TaxID=9361 RepID=UPI00265EB428|nr:ICOS ligand [Dasypus novemcinctus]
MRPTSLGLLLLLLRGLLAETQGERAQGLGGRQRRAPLRRPGGHGFNPNELFVYWQIGKTVVTYYLPGNSSLGHEENRYRGRARLSLGGMRHGDFSLRLFNVTPQDEQTYSCLVFQRSSGVVEKVLDVTVTPGTWRQTTACPTSAPAATPSSDELTLTCRAANGYPSRTCTGSTRRTTGCWTGPCRTTRSP